MLCGPSEPGARGAQCGGLRPGSALRPPLTARQRHFDLNLSRGPALVSTHVCVGMYQEAAGAQLQLLHEDGAMLHVTATYSSIQEQAAERSTRSDLGPLRRLQR